MEAGEEATSPRPLTVRRRRTAPAAARTAPRLPAPRGRSPRSPGPGSRRGWSPWCLPPGGPTPSGSRGKHNAGQAAGGKGRKRSPVPGWERSPRCAHRVPHPTTGTPCHSHRGHPGQADKAKTPLFFPQRGHRGSPSPELGHHHSADRINPAPFSWTTRQTAGNLPEAARCFAEPC